MLESMERHLCGNSVKVYDPFVTKDMVENQYHDLDAFLRNIDMVVIIVKHDEIKENMDMLSGKVVLDCHNICESGKVYHL